MPTTPPRAGRESHSFTAGLRSIDTSPSGRHASVGRVSKSSSKNSLIDYNIKISTLSREQELLDEEEAKLQARIEEIKREKQQIQASLVECSKTSFNGHVVGRMPSALAARVSRRASGSVPTTPGGSSFTSYGPMATAAVNPSVVVALSDSTNERSSSPLTVGARVGSGSSKLGAPSSQPVFSPLGNRDVSATSISSSASTSSRSLSRKASLANGNALPGIQEDKSFSTVAMKPNVNLAAGLNALRAEFRDSYKNIPEEVQSGNRMSGGFEAPNQRSNLSGSGQLQAQFQDRRWRSGHGGAGINSGNFNAPPIINRSSKGSFRDSKSQRDPLYKESLVHRAKTSQASLIQEAADGPLKAQASVNRKATASMPSATASVAPLQTNGPNAAMKLPTRFSSSGRVTPAAKPSGFLARVFGFLRRRKH